MMGAEERVAALTALQKAVRTALDAARAEADGQLLADYERDGVTRKALRVAGEKVGDYLVVMEKPGWEVVDRGALASFALDYGFARIARSIRPEWSARAAELVADELPEAVEEEVRLDAGWERYLTEAGEGATYLDSGMTVPGVRRRGPRVKGTQVRGCAPEAVAPLVARAGGVRSLLLEEAGA